MAKEPRVVVDTGILVSAFVFGGRPKEAITHIIEKAEVWVSPDILAEYREVPLDLERDEKITREQLKALIAGVAAFVLNARVSYPRKSISLCRDEEDDMILECCLASKADYLVTGDKDLLEIDATALASTGLGKLKILNPRDFLYSFK